MLANMSAKKKILLVCMAFIVIAIGMIFVMFSEKKSSNERLDEARKYIENLDYDHAIAIYNDILRTEKQSTAAYMELAEAYLKKGNESKAIEILERGLPYAKNNLQFQDMLAELKGKEGYADAEDDLLDRNMNDDEIIPPVQQTEENVPDSESEINIPETPTETEAAVNVTTVPIIDEPPVPATTTAYETQPPATTAATTTAAPVTTTKITTTAKIMVEVPDFTGMSKTDALLLAQSLNLQLNIEYKETNKYDNDIIYNQGRKAGTSVSERTSVSVYVAVNPQPTEEDLNIEKFYNTAKEWGELNSDKVKSVTYNQKSSTVTLSLSSIKRFTLDSSVMEAFAECKDAVMVVNSSPVSIRINSSSVKKADKLNLSAEVYGNTERVSVKIGNSGSLNCTASVTILDCDISSSDLKDKVLYYNNKKGGTFSINSDGKPVITITNSGQYIIR